MFRINEGCNTIKRGGGRKQRPRREGGQITLDSRRKEAKTRELQAEYVANESESIPWKHHDLFQL